MHIVNLNMDVLPDEGRDEKGKWLIFKSKHDREEQSDFPF